VRDRSNYNNVFDNTFNATGGVAAYLDDFCDQQCVNTANPKKYRECASYGNRFAYNTIYTGTFWDLIGPGRPTPAAPLARSPKDRCGCTPRATRAGRRVTTARP
jgi:hypothetical protein